MAVVRLTEYKRQQLRERLNGVLHRMWLTSPWPVVDGEMGDALYDELVPAGALAAIQAFEVAMQDVKPDMLVGSGAVNCVMRIPIQVASYHLTPEMDGAHNIPKRITVPLTRNRVGYGHGHLVMDETHSSYEKMTERLFYEHVMQDTMKKHVATLRYFLNTVKTMGQVVRDWPELIPLLDKTDQAKGSDKKAAGKRKDYRYGVSEEEYRQEKADYVAFVSKCLVLPITDTTNRTIT